MPLPRVSPFWAAIFVGLACCGGNTAQAQSDGGVPSSPAAAAPQDVASLPDDPDIYLTPALQAASGPPQPGAAPAPSSEEQEQGKQTKRILYIVPNFRAVSADSHLPPQPFKEKLTTATEDSFDYSSFIFVGIQAGLGQWGNSYPEFGEGMRGYGRYYWHTFADDTDENLWVEFLLPVALHQDTRYYTLGRGGFGKRLVYAISRAAITRNDDGHETFNASEIFGSGAAAGLSGLYYPSQERTVTKFYQRWITNLLIDSGTFAFKEFWPNINNSIFHQKS